MKGGRPCFILRSSSASPGGAPCSGLSAQRAKRAHLGHAPGVQDRDAVLGLERLRHGARARPSRRSTTRRSGREPAPGGFEVFEQASQTVGTAGRARSRPRCSSSSWIEAPSSLAPGITSAAPTIGAEKASAQLLAWNIGTTGHHHVAATRCPSSRQRSQARAARWSDASRARPWLAGGAGGVAEACRRVLVEPAPGEILIRFGDPVLVSDGVLQPGLGHVGCVGQDHVAFDRGQAVASFSISGTKVRSRNSSRSSAWLMM